MWMCEQCSHPLKMVKNVCEWFSLVGICLGMVPELSKKVAPCTIECNYSYIDFSNKIVASTSSKFTSSRLLGSNWGTLQTVSKWLQVVTSGYRWLQGVWLSGVWLSGHRRWCTGWIPLKSARNHPGGVLRPLKEPNQKFWKMPKITQNYLFCMYLIGISTRLRWTSM